MNNMRWIFAEPDGSFSWRKGLTFVASLAFLFAIAGYFIWGKILPKLYWGTISGVFSFYFFKDFLRIDNFKKKKIMQELILTRKYLPQQTEGFLALFSNDDLVFDCFILELPWINNGIGISCIPEGEYLLIKEKQEKRGNVLRFTNVPGREGVLMHSGNYISDTRGCLLPGDQLTDINEDGLKDVINSKRTLDKLFSLIKEDQIFITIKS